MPSRVRNIGFVKRDDARAGELMGRTITGFTAEADILSGRILLLAYI